MRRHLALLVALSMALPIPVGSQVEARPRARLVAAPRADARPARSTLAFLHALRAVVVDNELPPETYRPARRPRRGLHRLLFDKVPAVARTFYEAERLTEERVLGEVGADLFGVQIGVTWSQIDTVKPRGRAEIVHVVNLDGSSNLEHVAKRFEIPHGHGQRLELQSLALNGGDHLGVRLLGVGLTGDVLSGRAPKGLSYTAEAKITDRTIGRWADLFAPLALETLRQTLDVRLGDGVAHLLGAAVPGVSAALAGISIRKAVRLLRTREARSFDKVLAVAHAAADVVRVVDPIVGTLANGALVLASVGVSIVRLGQLRMRMADEARARAIIDRHEQDPPPHVEGDEDGDGIPDIGDDGQPQRRR